MKTILTISLLLSVCASALGQSAGLQAERNNKDQQALLKIEQEWCDVYKNGDVATLRRLLADEFLYTDADGKLYNREQYIESVLKHKVESYSLSETTIKIYGDSAILSAVWTDKSSLNGQDTSGASRFIDVFVKRNGRWLAIASQDTRLPSTTALDEAAIIAQEEQAFEAWKNKDQKFFQETVAEAAQSIDRFGRLTKEHFLGAIASHNCTIKSYGLDNLKVTTLNPDTALLTYRYTQDTVCAGKPEPSPVWASTVYVKRGGKWLAGFHQETPALFATAPVEAAVNAEQEVRRVHQEYDRAWLQQDAAAFERLLADDAALTEQDGKVTPKAEIVANAKSGEVKFEVGHSDDVKVRVYGDTAVVTARWTEKSTNKGKPFAGTMQNTVVFVKRNGNWQVVSDQVTVIAPEKSKP